MPDIWYDVDVALAELPICKSSLIDDGDFKTREESVTYDQAGLDLVWNFVTTAGAFTQTAVTPTDTGGDYDFIAQGNGHYTIEMPASGGASINNSAEGVGWFTGFATGILPWTGPTCGFRAASINDAFIDSDTLIDSIDNGLLYESVITTVTSQVEFIMTKAFAVDDAWNGNVCSLEDTSTGESYSGGRWITDCLQGTEVLKINLAFPVTAVAGDKIRIYKERHPTHALELYGTAKTSGQNTILAKLLAYFQLALRKDGATATDNSTELTEIKADGGSGAGTYDNTSDALEARADTLDDTNITKVKGTTITGSGTAADPWGP